jgi:hypothetical protein
MLLLRGITGAVAYAMKPDEDYWLSDAGALQEMSAGQPDLSEAVALSKHMIHHAPGGSPAGSRKYAEQTVSNECALPNDCLSAVASRPHLYSFSIPE